MVGVREIGARGHVRASCARAQEGEPILMAWRRSEAGVKKGTMDGHGNVYFFSFYYLFRRLGVCNVFYLLGIVAHSTHGTLIMLFESMWL